jgi:hydrogenase expression/formation protein HypC
MCLGEILQLVEVADAGDRAVGRRGEALVPLSLITLEAAVAPGDWVVAHAGFALERLSAQDAAEALAVRRQPESAPAPTPEEQP